MSATGQPESGRETPPESNPGEMPGNAHGSGETPPPGAPSHTATGEPSREGDDETHSSTDGLRNALTEERNTRKELEKELKTIRAAEKARADAEKSDLEKYQERAETAERRVAVMERESLARQVAAEHGIPSLWHRLSGDDARALRADAGRLRSELGLGEGALDGGVRSTGAPSSATPSMDELIRQGAGR